jgi:hypothetical protein
MSDAPELYRFALFLHVLTVVLAFSAATLLHLGHHRLRAATHRGPALDAAVLSRRVAPWMPVFTLALFLTGGYLAHLAWSWRTPWIVAASLGLLAMLVIGGAVLKPKMQAAGMAIGRAEDGPLPAPVVRQLRDQVLWSASVAQVGIAFGILFLMVMKPGLMGSVLGMAGGLAAALVYSVPRRTETGVDAREVVADA